jgi:hypothetical protein
MKAFVLLVMVAITFLMIGVTQCRADQCHVEMRTDPYGHVYYVQVCTR